MSDVVNYAHLTSLQDTPWSYIQYSSNNMQFQCDNFYEDEYNFQNIYELCYIKISIMI